MASKEQLKKIKDKLKEANEQLTGLIGKLKDPDFPKDKRGELIDKIKKLKHEALGEFPEVMGKPFFHWYTRAYFIDEALLQASLKDENADAQEMAKEAKKWKEKLEGDINKVKPD